MEQLNGNEPFTLHGSDTSIMLQDVWRWAYSDLLNNTHRGVLAEFLVHSALETKDVTRADWLPFDLTSPSGLRIEVKSSAYLQAWTPEDVFSQISFDIAKKFAWDGATYASMAMRNSDLYVFCVFTARTRDVSILDLDYWDFYVLPTSVLNEKVPEQKTITLSSLLKLEPAKTDFAGLPAAVARLGRRDRAGGVGAAGQSALYSDTTLQPPPAHAPGGAAAKASAAERRAKCAY